MTSTACDDRLFSGDFLSEPFELCFFFSKASFPSLQRREEHGSTGGQEDRRQGPQADERERTAVEQPLNKKIGKTTHVIEFKISTGRYRKPSTKTNNTTRTWEKTRLEKKLS